MDLSTFDFRTGKMLMSKVNKGRQRVRYDSPSQVKVSPWELLLGAVGGRGAHATTTTLPPLILELDAWLLLGGDLVAMEKQKEDRDPPATCPGEAQLWSVLGHQAPGTWNVYKSPVNKCSGTLAPALIAGQRWLRAPGPCSAENGTMRQEGAGVCPQPPTKLTKGSTSTQAWA